MVSFFYLLDQNGCRGVCWLLSAGVKHVTDPGCLTSLCFSPYLRWLQSRCWSFVLVKHLCRRRSRRVCRPWPHKVCIHTIKSCTVGTNHHHSTQRVASVLPHFALSPDNPGFISLLGILVSFLDISPRDRETYQMSLMRPLIEEHLYHSLIGHGKKCLCSNVIDARIGEWCHASWKQAASETQTWQK